MQESEPKWEMQFYKRRHLNAADIDIDLYVTFSDYFKKWIYKCFGVEFDWFEIETPMEVFETPEEAEAGADKWYAKWRSYYDATGDWNMPLGRTLEEESEDAD